MRTKLNLPPESVVYTGIYDNIITTLEVFSYDQNTINYTVYTDNDFESEIIPLMDSDQKIWINIIGLNVVDTIIKLGEIFGLAPFVLEDIVHVSQRSKIEVSEQYIFTLFKMIYRSKDRLGRKNGQILHEHLSILLLDNIVLTFQENDGDVFDSVRLQIKEEHSKIRGMDSDFLYYSLIDALVDNQLEILTELGEEIENHEQMTIEEQPFSLEGLFNLRKQLLLIRSSAIPFKDILVELLSEKTNRISPQVKLYLADVADHVNHVSDLVTLSREMVNNVYEINMLNTGNKLNHIMAVLTVFSAVFIPLNFLTGFFGMNFSHFPGMQNPYSVPVFLGVSLLISGGMILFFKKKKWF